jgi:hypothetical protein
MDILYAMGLKVLSILSEALHDSTLPVHDALRNKSRFVPNL